MTKPITGYIIRRNPSGGAEVARVEAEQWGMGAAANHIWRYKSSDGRSWLGSHKPSRTPGPLLRQLVREAQDGVDSMRRELGRNQRYLRQRNRALAKGTVVE